MATEGTKLPAVYKIPSTADPQLKLFAESVREILEVRLGRRGDPRDRFVTLRELIDSGLAKELKDNPFEPNAAIPSVGFTASFEDTERITSTIPPKPTGFTVAAAYTSFNLSWNHPQLANFAYTEIWRHTSNDVSSAVRIDTTPAHVWSEEVGYAKTYYYWVRHVTKADVIGPFSDVGSGSTSIDIGAVMTALTEDLQDLPGYDTLQTLISGSAGTAATVIKSSSAPTTRANGDDLTANDIWYDTDDGQVHTRNSANNAWVAARDATLVNVVGTSSYTGSSLTAAMSTAQSDVVTLTNANSARASEINSLTATVDTKARTFVQDGIPTATAVGDIWIDSNDNNKMYRAAAADADQIASGEWVLVRDTLNDDYPRVFTASSAPTAINTGDIWFDTDDSNKQYRWNGSNWVAVIDVVTDARVATEATARANGDSANALSISNLTATVSTKTQTFVQTGPPTSVAVGDLWVDSDDNNKLYRAAAIGADEVAAGEWVLVRDTVNDNYPRIFTQTSAPTAVNSGDIWFDTDDSNKQYRWDGSSWTEVRDVLTQAAVTTEAEARAEEDAANASAIESLEAIVNTKAKTFVQDDVPTATAIGDLWIDSNDSNKLYRAASATADQITSGEWVLVRDTVNDGKTTVFTNASPPTANNTGDLWFDSDDSYKQYRWDGSNWQVIRDVLTQASVTTVQNAVANGTSAEAGYGISVNANNAIAGMYLMASSNGTMQNNTSTSDIIFEADQVSIRNPHGTDIVPFTVLTSTDGAGNPAGVYINQAYLKDASIAAAQIGSVNAGTISAGTISAERIGADTIDASKLVLDDTTLTSQVINGTPTLKVNALSATLITSDTLNSDRINVDTLNVKSFDNVSSTIVSHVTAATKFPLARDGQAYIQRTSVYTGSDGSFVPVTITQVRDNAGYVAVFSGVLGDVDGGRVQYSLNNSTWVDANGNTDISWSAGTYRGYTYVYTGQITTLSASQSTVYWRVYFSGTYNHTQLSLNIMMDNTR